MSHQFVQVGFSYYFCRSRSNLPKLKKALTEREIIETDESGIYLANPLFAFWFKREMM